MTNDDLTLIINDVMAALPEEMNGGEIASILASIVASYSDSDESALMHIQTAALILCSKECRQ